MMATLNYDDLYKSLVLERDSLDSRNDEESIEIKSMLSEIIDIFERNPELAKGLANCDSMDFEKINKLEADYEKIQEKLLSFITKIKGKYGRVF